MLFAGRGVISKCGIQSPVKLKIIDYNSTLDNPHYLQFILFVSHQNNCSLLVSRNAIVQNPAVLIQLETAACCCQSSEIEASKLNIMGIEFLWETLHCAPVNITKMFKSNIKWDVCNGKCLSIFPIGTGLNLILIEYHSLLHLKRDIEVTYMLLMLLLI